MPKQGGNFGAARKELKTLEELSKTYKDLPSQNKILGAQTKLIKGQKEDMEAIYKTLKEIVKVDKDRLKIQEIINRSNLKRLDYDKADLETQKELEKKYSSIFKYIKETEKEEDNINKSLKARRRILSEVESVMRRLSAESKEQFKLAQDMQIQANLTWRQYTEVYDKAYQSARRMNQEIGQSLFKAKDMIEMQNKLMRDGWRNIDMGTMTDVAASMRMASTALGIDFPEALSRAFQSSYKQFGDQTASFVSSITNRLNVFQGEFGVHIGMLTGVVQELSASTSFLYRNNMQAQIQANESFIRAAALAGRVGLTTSSFISDLAGTANFGTVDEMSGIYQAGAMLQGFDTSNFQRQLQTPGQESSAISSLFESIYGTMKNLEGDQYLRNLYMQEIGSGFGLSRDDMLNIMTHGGNLSEYNNDLTETLLETDKSIEKELSGLRTDISDRLTNWWDNTTMVQSYNRVMQGLGLHGISGQLKTITGLVSYIATSQGFKDIGGIDGLKGVGNWLGQRQGVQGIGGVGPMELGGMTNLQRIGLGGLGAAGMYASQTGGRALQQSSSRDDNIGGGLINVLGGAASGAMIGTAIAPGIGTVIGAGLGAGIGIINTIAGAEERKSAMREVEDRRRVQARQSLTTGDPLLDAINRQTEVLEGAITGVAPPILRAAEIQNLTKETSTSGKLNIDTQN